MKISKTQLKRGVYICTPQPRHTPPHTDSVLPLGRFEHCGSTHPAQARPHALRRLTVSPGPLRHGRPPAVVRALSGSAAAAVLLRLSRARLRILGHGLVNVQAPARVGARRSGREVAPRREILLVCGSSRQPVQLREDGDAAPPRNQRQQLQSKERVIISCIITSFSHHDHCHHQSHHQ